MENNNLYINSQTTEDSISKLKEYANRFETIYELLKFDFRCVKENTTKCYWSGTIAEDVDMIFDEYGSKFDKMKEKTDEMINFLEKVKEAYVTVDEEINSKIDSNSELGITGGSVEMLKSDLLGGKLNNVAEISDVNKESGVSFETNEPNYEENIIED